MRAIALTCIEEPIVAGVLSQMGVATLELVTALHRSWVETGEVTLECVAAAGSELPGVVEVAAAADGGESLYASWAEDGRFDGYDLVHVMAPLKDGLRRLEDRPVGLVHTVMKEADDRCLPPGTRLHRVVGEAALATKYGAKAIAPPVDLLRFRPSCTPEHTGVLCLDPDMPQAVRAAFCHVTGLDVVSIAEEDPAESIRRASCFIDASDVPFVAGSVWALRALASGCPVVGWRGGGVAWIAADARLGAVVEPGDLSGLVRAALDSSATRSSDHVAARREFVLACHNRRAVAAKYRRIYKAALRRDCGK
jgi:hypothetical protein